MDKIKIIAGLFIGLLVFIILAANLGWGPTFFSMIYIIPGGDKIGHFILMGILSLLVNLAIQCKRVRFFSQEVLLGSIIILVVVTLEEFSQIFLNNRGFSFVDLLADYIGILIFGRLAVYIFERSLLERELGYRRNSDG